MLVLFVCLRSGLASVFKAKISIFNIYFRIFKNKWFLKNIVILLNSHFVLTKSGYGVYKLCLLLFFLLFVDFE